MAAESYGDKVNSLDVQAQSLNTERQLNQEFCDIDKKADDVYKVSSKIDNIVLSLKKLID